MKSKKSKTKLLTIAEVAAELHVATGTLYNWAAEGRIKFIKLAPRMVRIEERELLRLIKVSKRVAKST